MEISGLPRTKRQRRENPITPLDHVSLECVASPQGPIRTSVSVSSFDFNILLSRFEIEIVKGFHGRWKRQATITATAKSKRNDGDQRIQQPPKLCDKSTGIAQRVWRSRICVGTNACTRAIEDRSQQMWLMLAVPDLPNLHAHIVHRISVAADKPAKPFALNTIKFLILPKSASGELARILGIPKCSIVGFTRRVLESERQQDGLIEICPEVDKYHSKIDSFVDFCISKMNSSDA
jgi:hypothetical protein